MGRGRNQSTGGTRRLQDEIEEETKSSRNGTEEMKHFGIAWALLRFYFRLIPRDWYRSWPFLPLAPREYLQWRLRTAYGKHRPPIREILRDLWQYGDWLRTFDSQ
jgi:hypothetical protein